MSNEAFHPDLRGIARFLPRATTGPFILKLTKPLAKLGDRKTPRRRHHGVDRDGLGAALRLDARGATSPRDALDPRRRLRPRLRRAR